METVTAKRVDEAHAIFSEHMGFDESSWKAVFEFVQYISTFKLLNLTKEDVRSSDEITLPSHAIRAINMLHGPHAGTFIAAYKHRRYSLRGRIRTAFIKPTYIVGFIAVVIVAAIIDLWESV